MRHHHSPEEADPRFLRPVQTVHRAHRAWCAWEEGSGEASPPVEAARAALRDLQRYLQVA